MYTIGEQIEIIVYFLIFGIFSVTMYRIFCYYLKRLKIKKVLSFVFEFIFWIFLTLISCKYLLISVSGYLPLYGIVFYIGGIVIYFYLLDKKMYENLDIFSLYMGKIILEFFYSKEIIGLIKKVIKKVKIRRKKNEKSSSLNNFDV